MWLDGPTHRTVKGIRGRFKMSKQWRGQIGIYATAVLATAIWISSLEAADKKYTTLTNEEAQKILDDRSLSMSAKRRLISLKGKALLRPAASNSQQGIERDAERL